MKSDKIRFIFRNFLQKRLTNSENSSMIIGSGRAMTKVLLCRAAPMIVGNLAGRSVPICDVCGNGGESSYAVLL